MSEDTGVQLSSEVIEAIRQFVTSDAWECFFKPALEAMKKDWMVRLMDQTEKRKADYPDDFIRGAFQTIDVFLKLPDALIEEHDADQERKADERKELSGFEDRTATGKI